MDEHFTCRNRHRWRLSLDGPAAINARWVFCPACGAPPRPAIPMTIRQCLRRWAQRNPAVVGLLASIFAMVMAFTLLAVRIWRDV